MSVTVPSPSITPSPDSLEAAEQMIRAHLQRARIPGAALAVVHLGEPIHVRGIGQTSLQNGRPVTPDTMFQIGSLTKSFTAMAIMQLRDRGLLELDASVQRYLPWFQVADPLASANVTVRHLLTHTSGLYGSAWKVGLDDPAIRRSPEKAARALRQVRLHNQPGVRWEYSNLNYTILGLIIEAVSGVSYARYIRGEILHPLNMNATSFDTQLMQERPHAVPCQHRFGWPVETAFESDTAWMEAAGASLASSVQDLARWVAVQLGANRDAVLSPYSLLQSHMDGVPIPSEPGTIYGFGWQLTEFYGERLVYHAGGTGGHSSFIGLLPERQVGFVVLFGAAGDAAPPGLWVARLLQGGKVAPKSATVNPLLAIGYGGTGAGLLLVVGLVLSAGREPGLPLTVIVVLLAVAAWALPVWTRRNPRLPLPVPLKIGFGGYPFEVGLAWWTLTLSLTLWTLYAVLMVLR